MGWFPLAVIIEDYARAPSGTLQLQSQIPLQFTVLIHSTFIIVFRTIYLNFLRIFNMNFFPIPHLSFYKFKRCVILLLIESFPPFFFLNFYRMKAKL